MVCQGLTQYVAPELEAVLRKEVVIVNGTPKILIADELVSMHPSFRVYILTRPGMSAAHWASHLVTLYCNGSQTFSVFG